MTLRLPPLLFLLWVSLACHDGDSNSDLPLQQAEAYEPMSGVPAFNPMAEPLDVDFELLLALQNLERDDVEDFLEDRELTCKRAFDRVKWFDLRSRVQFRDQDVRPVSHTGQRTLMQACSDELNLGRYDRAYWRMRWCTETDGYWFCPLDIRADPEMPTDRWLDDRQFDAWWVALMRHDRANALSQLRQGLFPGDGWQPFNIDGFLRRTAGDAYDDMNPIFLSETRVLLSELQRERIWEQPWGHRRQLEARVSQRPEDARTYVEVKPDRAEASSVWQNDEGDDPQWGPGQVLDRDPNGRTAWAAAESDERPTLSLFYDTPVELNRLEIVGGISENSDHGYAGRHRYPVEVKVTLHGARGATEDMAWWLGLPLGWEVIGRKHQLFPFLRNDVKVGGIVRVDIQIFLYWPGSRSAQLPIADVLLYELEQSETEPDA